MPNEKTPMETLIAKYKALPVSESAWTRKLIEAFIKDAEELLPSERKMVEDAYDAGIQPYGARDGSQYFDNRFRKNKN